MKASRFLAVLVLVLAVGLLACSGGKKDAVKIQGPAPADNGPPPPAKIPLVTAPVLLQDKTEPLTKRLDFDFDLPRPPERARLVMRYSGVVGGLSEDYKMGRFRDRVELNDRFLMDLNTYSEGEDRVVEYTKWISVGMFKRHNKLSFIAGDDGNREDTPRIDEFTLREAHLEFEW